MPLHTAATHQALLPSLQAMHPGRDWVLLTIGADASDVWRPQPAPQPPSVHRLPLGYRQLAAQYLTHAPPSDSQVERVIEVVEDQVMPLTRAWPAPTAQFTLACRGAPLQTLVAQLPSSGQALHSADDVEQLFNRFANIAMGGAAAGLHISNEQAAFLTMLRECMHHWGCHSLVVLPD